ncbi:MAG: efflux transporter, family, subunit [Myxococcaceae bacterium]|nr:efflux transporter, family, subunit [Myxococcaceae bacterium]
MSGETLVAAGAAPKRVSWPRYVALSLIMACLAYGVRSWVSLSPEPPRRTVPVSRGEIVSKTLASGRIVPREEIFVRSLVAGVLAELTVRPGDVVHKGQQIALIRVVADPVILSDARSQVKLAEQRVARSQRELTRVTPLGGGVALSGQEVAKAEDELRLARTELDNAHERVRLVSQGAAGERGTRSTRVLSPITGTVLALPVAIGDVIGDTNSYRDGTTLAVVADMTQLLFKGQVEEAHVGKLWLGMPSVVRIGALAGTAAPGVLTWISPRATVEATGTTVSTQSSTTQIAPLTATSTGITRFELWVALTSPPEGARAGYSATAELTLERRSEVLVVEERALKFEDGKVLAAVAGAHGETHEREIQVGASDGLKIEVVSGLKEGERLAYPDET